MRRTWPCRGCSCPCRAKCSGWGWWRPGRWLSLRSWRTSPASTWSWARRWAAVGSRPSGCPGTAAGNPATSARRKCRPRTSATDHIVLHNRISNRKWGDRYAAVFFSGGRLHHANCSSSSLGKDEAGMRMRLSAAQLPLAPALFPLPTEKNRITSQLAIRRFVCCWCSYHGTLVDRVQTHHRHVKEDGRRFPWNEKNHQVVVVASNPIAVETINGRDTTRSQLLYLLFSAAPFCRRIDDLLAKCRSTEAACLAVAADVCCCGCYSPLGRQTVAAATVMDLRRSPPGKEPVYCCCCCCRCRTRRYQRRRRRRRNRNEDIVCD